MELVIARNPDPESRLPYLLRVPQGAGLVFSTVGTWPRSRALYCHPLGLEDWPDDAEVVERTGLRSCRRRGAAIDLILDRSRDNRSQLVFTTARGRDAVFWQTPRVRKQARPQVRTPTARAAGVAELEIIVDAHERDTYRFGRQAVRTVSRPLPCGDYGIVVDGRLVAAVERKSLADLVASLTGGKLHYALGDLAALPRAALVVEDRYGQIYKLDRVRPRRGRRWPRRIPGALDQRSDRVLRDPPTRRGMDYRFLAAAYTWAQRTRRARVSCVPEGTSATHVRSRLIARDDSARSTMRPDASLRTNSGPWAGAQMGRSGLSPRRGVDPRRDGPTF